MGILSWILMGLIVGVIAKLVMPGPDPGGIFITILLGIGGAFVGGYVGSFLGLGSVTGFNLGSLLLSVGGAVLILILYRTIRKKRRSPAAWSPPPRYLAEPQSRPPAPGRRHRLAPRSRPAAEPGPTAARVEATA